MKKNMDTKKICKTCKLEKNIPEFCVRTQRLKDGSIAYKNICRKCDNKRIDASRKLRGKDRIKKQVRYNNDPNKYKTYTRKSNLIRKYGITLDDYNKILEVQNYSCAICKTHKDTFNKSLAVDHCHSTGKIRGLLCDVCNRGLGYYKDNINRLQEAIKYLQKLH